MRSFFICQNCGIRNSPDSSVCKSCNAALGIHCEKCGTLNSSTLNYCEHCGKKLKNKEGEEKKPDAERLHLNIMFCDLVGSTELSESLDPEVLRDIVVAYQEVCAKAIEKQGGFIAQYLGDGILVYFGYPKTYEDNSQRAVQAAFEIVDHVKILSEKLEKEGKVGIAVRIGIHAGLVVIGEVGGGETRERLALGETPNIAARIQSLAEPNEILISAETYKIVQKIIYCRERGTHVLKGISTPVTVYEPVSVQLAKSFTTEQTQYDYSLVGREQVIKKLNAWWKKVLLGKTEGVILRGEIGTGKTHVINYFTALIADKEAKKIFFKCTSYTQNNSLFPFINILDMLIDIEKDESDPVKISKVEKFLKSHHFALPETFPIISSLLSIPLPSDYQPLSSSSSRIVAEMKFNFFKKLFVELSEAAPVILIVEDIHFADKSSLNLFNFLMHPSNHKIFIILSSRPEVKLPLDDNSNFHHINLYPLDKSNAEKLILQIAGKKLPDEILQLITEKTQGIPLFIEELLTVIFDSDVLEPHKDHFTMKGPLPESLIPSTLQDLLFAKLDQLGKAKEFAQLAAVFGRDFTADMMQQISGLDFKTLTEYLNTLVDESVLIVKGRLPNIYFSFKQALMEEKAYQLLLISKRQQYHLMIGETLEKYYPSYVQANPEFIAQHFTLGEKFITAIEYWYKAATFSLSQSAFEEAIVFFQKGMDLIVKVRNAKKRNALELMILSGLAPSLLTTKGYTDESVAPAFERAYELVKHVRNLPYLSTVLSGLWAHFTVAAKHETARIISVRLHNLAIQSTDPFIHFEAGKAIGANLFWRGEFVMANKQFVKTLKKFNPENVHEQAYQYAEHPVVSTLIYHSISSWMLGDSEQSRKSSEGALSYAQKLNHPFTLTYVSGMMMVLHQLRGDVTQSKTFAKETLKLGERYGFSFWIETSKVFYRWSVALKQPGKGLKEMETMIADLGNSGASLWKSSLLGILAALNHRSGQRKKAQLLIDDALRLAVKNNEKFFYAELLRIKGEILLSSRMKMEAKKFFNRALKTAEKQEAKYFKLRALIDLASIDGKKKVSERSRQAISLWLKQFPAKEKTNDVVNAVAFLKQI